MNAHMVPNQETLVCRTVQPITDITILAEDSNMGMPVAAKTVQ
jgi:hypothetical protein